MKLCRGGVSPLANDAPLLEGELAAHDASCDDPRLRLGGRCTPSTSPRKPDEVIRRVRYFSCMTQTPSHASSGGLA